MSISSQSGRSFRPTPRDGGKTPSTGELLAAAQLAVLLLGSAWYFGGASTNARIAISIWGTIGAANLAVQLLRSQKKNPEGRTSLICLLPFVLFNTVTLCSLFHLNLVPLSSEGETLYIRSETVSAWLPSTATRPQALFGLWLFDSIYLSCCQLPLIVRRRGTIRLLLAVAATNAVALSIFGTLQKLIGATGLFFGSIASPQKYFFASFVYDNHWGAFCILSAGFILGLSLRIYRRFDGRDILRSPFVSGVACLLVVASAVPLSGSRACSILMLVLMSVATFEWLRTSIKLRQAKYHGTRAPYFAAFAIVAFSLSAIWFIAGDMISARALKTRDQVDEMMQTHSIGGRAILYRDTWNMAKDKLLFGWGANSYPLVFKFYNTTESKLDRIPVFFHDAHSDWLQAVAEHGLVGTALLALCAAIPLSRANWGPGLTSVPRYMLIASLLVFLYAGVEFPFGNPAVSVAWWFSVFAAVRYTVLEAKNT